MHWIDWTIVFAFVIGITAVVGFFKAFSKSVADFMAANRCAGRYLLTIAEGVAGTGAISIVAMFEQFYQAGFAPSFWNKMMAPLMMIITLSGWVIYRFRETRALTMSQFFEMRYNRHFRIFSGMICFLSGVINYGIFPAVTSRFFVYFCGLPNSFPFLGLEIQTYIPLMFVFLAIALYFTLNGGQVVIMITDFIQGQFMIIVFVLIGAFLVFTFDWSVIVSTLEQPQKSVTELIEDREARLVAGDPVDLLAETTEAALAADVTQDAVLADEKPVTAASQGKSKLNPFDTKNVPDFNLWFYLILAFTMVYGYMGWQGSQGYNASAKTPHEARMAKILGSWRASATSLLMIIMPIIAFVVLQNPAYQGIADSVIDTLGTIDKPYVQKQVTTTLAMREVLPRGIIGLFAAVMIAAAISTDNTYMHSWGSIFIQDVVLPLRKKPLGPKQHIKWLRRSIIGVAIFAFLFSAIFDIGDFIGMFFAITGAIYLGGAGACIIGGLYWKRGTSYGAYMAMIIGAVMGVGGVLLKDLSPDNVGILLFITSGTLLLSALIIAIWTLIKKSDTWRLALGLVGIGAVMALVGYFFHEQYEAVFKDAKITRAWLSFIVMMAASATYIIVSLITCKTPFNLEKMLHRGKWDDTGDHQKKSKPTRGLKAFGISAEFSGWDKFLYFASMFYTLAWFGVFIVVLIYNLTHEVTDSWWQVYWHVVVYISLGIGLVVSVWFTIGGIIDMIDLTKTLKSVTRDESDDGTVWEHQNTDDEIQQDKDTP